MRERRRIWPRRAVTSRVLTGPGDGGGGAEKGALRRRLRQVRRPATQARQAGESSARATAQPLSAGRSEVTPVYK